MIDTKAAVGALARRFAREPPSWQLPGWAPLVILLDFAILVPVLLVVGYTLGSIFPTLAIVEDPNPPAYEPVALNEDAADNQGEPAQSAQNSGKPVTSSLRATRRLLKGVAGWRSYFRGIVCAVVLAAVDAFVNSIVSSRLPIAKTEDMFSDPISLIPVGSLITQLALTQLGCAWTHIVISSPSKLPFYRRLPPFKKAFEATAIPIFGVWLANSATILVPALIASALGLKLKQPDQGHDGQTPFGEEPGNQGPYFDGAVVWKSVVVTVVAIILSFLVAVPATVLLVRVQASLLPPDEDTVVPFDRSFGGKVEPAVVGGKGFVTLRDALETFPRASWVRIYKLYAKIIGVCVALYVVLGAVFTTEALLIFRAGRV